MRQKKKCYDSIKFLESYNAFVLIIAMCNGVEGFLKSHLNLCKRKNTSQRGKVKNDEMKER